MKKITTAVLAILVMVVCALGVANAKGHKRIDMLTTTLGYDIIKQGEKLKTDPYDIKETDLRKFSYVCSDPSFKRKLKSNGKEFEKEVSDICEKIVSI